MFKKCFFVSVLILAVFYPLQPMESESSDDFSDLSSLSECESLGALDDRENDSHHDFISGMRALDIHDDVKHDENDGALQARLRVEEEIIRDFAVSGPSDWTKNPHDHASNFARYLAQATLIFDADIPCPTLIDRSAGNVLYRDIKNRYWPRRYYIDQLFEIALQSKNSSSSFIASSALEQGERRTNQDRVVADQQHKVCAVFDGHGERGDEVAQFAADNVFRCLRDSDGNMQPIAAFQNSSKILDSMLEYSHSDMYQDSGTTAVGCTVRDGFLHWFNCGDSRIVAAFKDGSVKQLSIDHKPTNPEERARIYNHGGFVCDDRRLNGDLDMSRTIGDGRLRGNDNYKLSIPEADHEAQALDGNLQFVVLASDGLWDKMSNEEVVSRIKSQLDWVFAWRRHFGYGCFMTTDIAKYLAEALIFEVQFNPDRMRKATDNISIALLFV